METEQHGGADFITKADLKRARITAIVFGVITGFSLICLVYAFVQNGITKEQIKVSINNAKIADSLRIKLDECAQEAFKQMKLAEAAAIEALKQNQRAEEALKKIPKK